MVLVVQGKWVYCPGRRVRGTISVRQELDPLGWWPQKQFINNTPARPKKKKVCLLRDLDVNAVAIDYNLCFIAHLR